MGRVWLPRRLLTLDMEDGEYNNAPSASKEDGQERVTGALCHAQIGGVIQSVAPLAAGARPNAANRCEQGGYPANRPWFSACTSLSHPSGTSAGK